MAGSRIEYRTLRTNNNLLISGAGFSIVVRATKKTIKKKEDKKAERRDNGSTWIVRNEVMKKEEYVKVII